MQNGRWRVKFAIMGDAKWKMAGQARHDDKKYEFFYLF
jgi:hypothetical protein